MARTSAHSAPAQVEDAIATLRAAGQRITRARRAVLDAIADADQHLTAEEIHVAVVRRDPDLHMATIYRTLDRLRELGIVEHTHLQHGPAVFHLAVEAHDHLVCDACGVVIDVPRSTFAALHRQLLRDHGFRVGSLHFAVNGTCAECSPPSAS
jgi:Fe2+ or Zn2+ uptake regulation protein